MNRKVFEKFLITVCAIAVGVIPSIVFAREIKVSSLAQLVTAVSTAGPGDVIVLKNGIYETTEDIVVTAAGNQENPITIKAESIGGVEVTGIGGFNLTAPAKYIIIYGFKFTHNASHTRSGAGTSFCRWSHNIFETKGAGESLTVAGDDHEIDFNTFQNKNTMGRYLAVRGSGSQIAQRLWIHHNGFYNFPYQGGANGAEPFQFGLSGFSLSSSNSVVEHNLFENCYGENELISVKASEVTLRYNTIRDCPAQFTLRHGNRCLVYGNYFFNTPGIRIFGDDHLIHSNYFENCEIGIQIGNGGAEVADGAPLTSHDRPDRVIIAFNTIVNSGRSIIQTPRENGLGSTGSQIIYNIILNGGSAAQIDGPCKDMVWKKNIVFGAASPGSMPSGSFDPINPLLEKDANGILHLSKISPAVNCVKENFQVPLTDQDGQERTTPYDIGADEISRQRSTAHALTRDQVGHSTGLKAGIFHRP